MAVRIQLASNFQVVELTYDCWEEVDQLEVNEATDLVNFLGKQVQNDIKTNKPQKSEVEDKKEEMATEGQISFLKKLGVSESRAKEMTKKEAWTYIQEQTKK